MESSLTSVVVACFDSGLRAVGPSALLNLFAARCRALSGEFVDDARWPEGAARLLEDAAASLHDNNEAADATDHDHAADDVTPEACAPDVAAPPDVQEQQPRDDDGAEEADDEDDGTEETTKEETTSMPAKDRIPAPADTVAWSAYRFDAAEGKHVAQKRAVNGMMVKHFGMRELTASTVRAWWGPGEYVFAWFRENGPGRIKGHGRTQPITLVPLGGEPTRPPQPEPRAETPDDVPTFTHAEVFAAATRAAMPATPAALGGMGASGFAEMMQAVTSMMSMMRQESRQEAQAQREASRHEAELAAAQRRAEMDLQLEREKIAAKERLAVIEANARSHGRGPGMDLDTLVSRIGEVVGAHVSQAVTSLQSEDEDDDDATPPPDPTVTIVAAIKETLGPLVPLVASRLAPSTPSLSAVPLPNAVKKNSGGSN